MNDKVKLHLGGTQAKEGWKILNILPGPDVDIIGSCTDLSAFGDETVDEIYASHVLEHLTANDAIKAAREMARVLKPGCQLKGSVPDLNILFRLFLAQAEHPGEQVKILHMIYGGHVDEFDIHHFGYTFQIMAAFLGGAGFTRIDQVKLLNEFSDTSFYRYEGELISLNFIATK